ncbi:MAG TPA: hypothetical protein VFE77_02955 [Rhodanobacter sp.]|nr:hypothetical protein [Rhodanobacter sp.]
MTTTVIVEAHCGENTEVLVTGGDLNKFEPDFQYVIFDGQKVTVYVHDTVVVGVYERPKKVSRDA